MILPLLLVAAAQQPSPEPVEGDEIVVLARRIGKVRWSYDAKDGALVRCTIKRSGGPTADAMVCEASRQCAAENPRMGDRHLAPCIKARVRTLFVAYRTARQSSATQGPGQP